MEIVTCAYEQSRRSTIIPSPPTSPALPERAPPSVRSVCPVTQPLHKPHTPHVLAPPPLPMTPLSLYDRLHHAHHPLNTPHALQASNHTVKNAGYFTRSSPNTGLE